VLKKHFQDGVALDVTPGPSAQDSNCNNGRKLVPAEFRAVIQL